MAEQNPRDREEPLKPSRTILVQEIGAGLTEFHRPTSGLFLSSLAAGLEIGFSLLLMALMLTMLQGQADGVVTAVVVANMYSIGFILVILGRSELFTEHTALAVLPVLDRQASVRELGRVWAVVFLGNMVGGAAFAVMTAWLTPRLGIVEPWALERIAHGLVEPPGWLILASAILAGWLMGELAWLVAAARDTISQVFFVWLIATIIGIAHLHHVVVGAVEVLAGLFVSDTLGIADFGHFLLWTTLGNALGGVVFVGLIKYGHAARSTGDEDDLSRR